MAQESQTLERDRRETDPSAESVGQGIAAPMDRTARLQLWLIASGFVMMFAASILMWVRFGPSMFVDLATAVMNCF